MALSTVSATRVALSKGCVVEALRLGAAREGERGLLRAVSAVSVAPLVSLLALLVLTLHPLDVLARHHL